MKYVCSVLMDVIEGQCSKESGAFVKLFLKLQSGILHEPYPFM